VTTIDDIADRAAAWHRARFPLARPEDVALKLAEEMGEVAAAVLADHASARMNSRGGNVPAEIADVVITAMALLRRWYDVRLSIAVLAKLAILEDPASGHRSAALEPPL
jgi:NTP pyrophosphatase (non-canonical NTP hydrolase)